MGGGNNRDKGRMAGSCAPTRGQRAGEVAAGNDEGGSFSDFLRSHVK
jgi:hypothetical protein